MNDVFAKRLQMALDHNNMRPVDLANKAGWTKGTVSQYLSGRNMPRNDRLRVLADILQVSPGWLLGYELQVGNDELIAMYNELSLSGKQKVLEYAEMLLRKERENV